MSPHNLHSELMDVIQYKISIIYASVKCGVHSWHNKDLISNFESSKKDKISKKQKNLIENMNTHQIF